MADVALQCNRARMFVLAEHQHAFYAQQGTSLGATDRELEAPSVFA